jgi:hypothetical protein
MPYRPCHPLLFLPSPCFPGASFYFPNTGSSRLRVPFKQKTRRRTPAFFSWPLFVDGAGLQRQYIRNPLLADDLPSRGPSHPICWGVCWFKLGVAVATAAGVGVAFAPVVAVPVV